MPTIDSKEIIKTILENNGKFADDPIPYRIYSYINDAGNLTQAIYYNKETDDIYYSPYCHNIKRLWTKEVGITKFGKDWLKENAKFPDRA